MAAAPGRWIPPSPARRGELADRFGSGALRRAVVVKALDARTVWGALEDEMHHFEVTVHHDGRVVTAVEGRAVRWPWTPCAEAPDALAALAGAPITTTASTIARHTDVFQQCSHGYDIAVWTIAHAARHRDRGLERRRYDAIVPDWTTQPFDASLRRDGEVLLEWRATIERIESPDPFTGVALRGGFVRWVEDNLDDDLAEAAMVLRRAVWIAPSRHIDLEGCDDGEQSGLARGVCYASQPGRYEVTFRNRHSLRDYGPEGSALLPDA